MGASSSHGVGPADLGFGIGSIVMALLLGAFVPATAALLFDVPLEAAGLVAGAGAVTTAMFGWLAFCRLGEVVVEPLQQMSQAMDTLKATGKARRIEESGAAVLNAMLHRFNDACAGIEERQQMSQANLMSVEVAFDRVHSVLQSLREGVIVVDLDGRVVLANRAARRVIRSDGIEGRYLGELVTGELQAAVRDSMTRIGATGAEEIKSTDISQHGRIYDLTVVQVQSTRPDRDFGRVVVLVDVTKNHEINKLKDDLLSSISHELRTPLTNMCSSSEILTHLDPTVEHEWREFAQILNVESHRLKTLVDDVMQYSQIETGRLPWNLERVEVAAQARQATDLHRGNAEKKDLTVLLTATGNTEVEADPQRLTEVICRVLDNAIKFTPEHGKVLLTVTANDDLVEVTIADSGPGIRPDDRTRVFERFGQIGNIMTDKPRGAGLGLAISQRIIDAMGGSMWCEDSPLGGAQFRFVLPQIGALA